MTSQSANVGFSHSCKAIKERIFDLLQNSMDTQENVGKRGLDYSTPFSLASFSHLFSPKTQIWGRWIWIDAKSLDAKILLTMTDQFNFNFSQSFVRF